MRARVLVMLSSYNGAKYIKEQINSILAQKGVDIELAIRDDGSVDNTCEVVELINDERITLYRENNIGATASFFELISKSGEYDYYAFSDQDDIWDDDKIFIAIKKIEAYSIPAVYSSNARLVDAQLNPLPRKVNNPLTNLGSAMIKNYVAGCTAVFNHRLMVKLKNYIPKHAPYHDWWINLVVLSIGGISVYDVEPHISYRQHGNNVVGATSSVIEKWKNRYLKFKTKRYHRELMAEEILEAFQNDLTEDSRDILKKMSEHKHRPWNIIFSKRFRTESVIDNIVFYICVLLDRV